MTRRIFLKLLALLPILRLAGAPSEAEVELETFSWTFPLEFPAALPSEPDQRHTIYLPLVRTD